MVLAHWIGPENRVPAGNQYICHVCKEFSPDVSGKHSKAQDGRASPDCRVPINSRAAFHFNPLEEDKEDEEVPTSLYSEPEPPYSLSWPSDMDVDGRF